MKMLSASISGLKKKALTVSPFCVQVEITKFVLAHTFLYISLENLKISPCTYKYRRYIC
uniref:Uncharacterized protein n=1 Tax=Rhizophora mucronata TaxID=61149 RepID=A0A2P2LJ28_RHIMU